MVVMVFCGFGLFGIVLDKMDCEKDDYKVYEDLVVVI